MALVIEVGGIGYEVRVPLSTLERLGGTSEVFLFARLLVREDDLRLYGFATEEERALFDLVLSVSGVGPAIALAALSALPARDLAAALASGDLALLRRIKGVGKRLAERLAVELKDRVALDLRLAGADPGAAGAARAAPDSLTADAVQALVALGFGPKDAEERAAGARERLEKSAEAKEITVERVIRESLR